LCSPSPGCCGDEVARTEYRDDTALADISGVRDTKVVVDGMAESCAVTKWNRNCSVKLRKRRFFISLLRTHIYEEIARTNQPPATM
jgi:hypothetical protein